MPDFYSQSVGCKPVVSYHFYHWGIARCGESMFEKERGGSSEERDLLLSTLTCPQIQRGTDSPPHPT